MSTLRLLVVILLLACASALPRRLDRDEESSGGGEIEHKGEPWGKPSFNDLDVPGHELFNDYELNPPRRKPDDEPPLYDFGEEDYGRPEEDEPHDSSADDNHDERKEEEEKEEELEPPVFEHPEKLPPSELDEDEEEKPAEEEETHKGEEEEEIHKGEEEEEIHKGEEEETQEGEEEEVNQEGEEDNIAPFPFDTAIFSFKQVNRYIKELEKAMQHVFQQTMEEASMLNSTFANTTEEEVEVEGHKYKIQKSIIKTGDENKNGTLLIEAVSSVNEENEPKKKKVKRSNPDAQPNQ